MLFFKMEGTLINVDAATVDNRRAQRESARKVFLKTDEFNRSHCNNAYCFVSNVSDGSMVAAMATEQAENAQSTMQAFLKYIDFQLKDVTFCETTIEGFQRLLSRANHFNYVEDSDEIIESCGLDRVLGRRGPGIEFGENLIADRSRKEILQGVERHLMNETMLPELERIYAGSPVKAQGHPVHYVLQTDSASTRREVTQFLLQALYANSRLHSKRYCFLNFRPGDNFSMIALDSLYNVCAGGALVIRYFANDDSAEADTAGGERDTIERICEVAKRHHNRVLTVICLPRECKHAKEIFYDNFGSVAFVELQENYVSGESAISYLKQLAKDHQVRTDKALFAKLEEEKKYLATDLQVLFEDWYNHKLRSTIYPQYKNLTTVKQVAVKAVPKGSAYDELQEMIGLTEAKSVIKKALNYYKMQKLYEEKGVKPDSPAMHMVFTGNPGTAKTTAARLFARIMKDNGLLSRGQLVEVGRGDLVGKYVGWTAQTVQSKFKAAKGGVLFIDEAYSLVDDRSGSFGDEAINTIVQEMENHREDVVVIFAGYPNEMEKFLQKNPGLRSRIAFHVPFADYSAEQLCQIAQIMGTRKGICFEEAALTKLTAAFESARKQSDFGNGRYVRNLLEQAKMNQASRLLEGDFEAITAEEVKTIRAVDIVVPDIAAEAKRTIGFAS